MADNLSAGRPTYPFATDPTGRDPSTGRSPGEAALHGVAPASDPITALHDLADQLEGASPSERDQLTFERAVDAVPQLVRDGRFSPLLRTAFEQVKGAADDETTRRASTIGGASATLLIAKTWTADLEQIVAIDRSHHGTAEAISKDGDLSAAGRTKKLDALRESTAKRVNAALDETSARVDEWLAKRHAALQASFGVPKAVEPDAQAVQRRELRLQTFAMTYAGIEDDTLRALVARLVETGSPFAPEALRYAALRWCDGRQWLPSFVASLGAGERGIALERAASDPVRLRAMVEGHMLRRLESRIRAQLGTLRRDTASAAQIRESWDQPFDYFAL